MTVYLLVREYRQDRTSIIGVYSGLEAAQNVIGGLLWEEAEGESVPQWLANASVDDGQGWGYLKDTSYKSVTELIHYLVDNVSKNGYMLLNVGPKPDGTIPDEATAILEGMGKWLDVNGEAIYGTVPWIVYGEGPTKMTTEGPFVEEREKVHFTSRDIRFTVKDNCLYAICLDWPAKNFTIEATKRFYPGEVHSVQMLGVDRALNWRMTDAGLVIERPDEKPCDCAHTFKITRNTSL